MVGGHPGVYPAGARSHDLYDRFAPPFFSDIGGAVFLASIGASFIAIFFTNREKWWAIIPGGALLSLASMVLVSQTGIGFLNPVDVLFIGLGLTFGLLGLMSTYLNTNLRWAYIPDAILLVMGIVISPRRLSARWARSAAGADCRGCLSRLAPPASAELAR